MTELQEMMLSVCFGAVIGMMAGTLVGLIATAIDNARYKRRRRKEEAAAASKRD